MVPEIQSSVLLDGVISLVDAEQALVLPDEAMKLARAQVAGGDSDRPEQNRSGRCRDPLTASQVD